MSDWISVDDKMPDEDSLVVVAHVYEFDMPPDVACCDFFNGRFHLADDGLEASNYDGLATIRIEFEITHWMPFPESPK